MSSELLGALDDAIAAMLRLRSLLATEKSEPAEPADNSDDLIDTWTASQRFSIPIDSIRWLAREKCFGEKRGGRWLVSVRALRQHVAAGG